MPPEERDSLLGIDPTACSLRVNLRGPGDEGAFPTASFLSETGAEQQTLAWGSSPVSHGSSWTTRVRRRIAARHTLQTIKCSAGMRNTYTTPHSTTQCLHVPGHTRGPVIGELINICAERPRREKTARGAFNTNAFGLPTKNNSGPEPSDMLHVSVSGGLGEIMMTHRRRRANIMWGLLCDKSVWAMKIKKKHIRINIINAVFGL